MFARRLNGWARLRLVAHETFIDAELACGRDAELVPKIEETGR